MANVIKPIEKSSVHKICSGQVVLNLAMAVKELVENSIDASSNVIEVRLKEYGTEMIEVSDNGTGVHPDNFEGLSLKHHTSKLQDFSDLVTVDTFGFRGEAISSLCALSDLSIVTRHASETCGTKIVFDNGGRILEMKPHARQIGTTVYLSNIFSTLPVRHKEFERNKKKEFAKMAQLLSAYCLIATGVKITCINQLKSGNRLTLLSTEGGKTVRDNISCLYGSKQLVNILEIVTVEPNNEILQEMDVKIDNKNLFKLEGYISSCEHGCGRSNADRQFTFINSRPCDLPKVMRLINETYHQFNKHQYPFVLLNIKVEKTIVDVNVTPDKRLIFLEHEKLLLATVKGSLLKMYESIPSIYKINRIAEPVEEVESINVETRSFHSTLDKFRSVQDKTTASTSAKREMAPQAESGRRIAKQIRLDNVFQYCDKNEIDSPSNDLVPTMKTASEVNISDITTENSNILLNDSTAERIQLPDEQEKELKIKFANEDVADNRPTHFESDTSIISIAKDSTAEQNNIKLFHHVENEDIPETNNRLNNYEVSNSIAEIEEVRDINNQLSEERDDNYDLSAKVIIDDTPVVGSCKNRRCVLLDVSIDNIEEILQRKSSDQKSYNSLEQQGHYVNKFHYGVDPKKSDLAEIELSKEITKDMFAKMKIVGQFNLGFIITRLGPDLFIIDQHATDEKYNFETLQKDTVLQNQKLVIPQRLELTVLNECTLLENFDILRKNGFEFEIDESAEPTKKIKLVAIPVSHNWQFGKSDIEEILFMLQDAPNTLCRPSRVRAMFASRACRKSVMIGTALSHSDMRRIVNHMGEIEQPWNCPHGRPTMRHLINLSLLQ